ncbi:MAG TPA: JAB domain-containing protein, partial [Paludibacteraceae bacterium]|nr:JAB domain-containing protein [Paludibacteraceae bacterium]
SEEDKPLYSTPYKNTREVLEAAINDKTLIIRMENAEGDKVVNKEQTCIVNDKIRDIRSKFQDWIIADRTRAQEIQKIYNSRYNRTVVTKFDGSHLNFEGIAITPRPHQKDAVWMVMQRRGGIIDHMVGAGKTLVMESAAMEMKRTGMIKKPLLIGLKANVQQMANEFLRFYPNANILAPTEKDFTKQNRRNLLSKIAVNDYDCIILTHDQYKQLEHTNEIKREVYEEKINELESAILFLENAKDNQGYGTDDLTKRQLKALENRKSNLRSKLNKLTQQNNVDEGFCFENLGFDFLMVDESHKFKNLEYATKYTRVAGLGNSTGSKGAMQLLFGVRSMQKLHGGDNGVVFASGTTITNSIVELYNILQYMRPNEMKKLGFSSFDAWASNYAERSTEFEFSVTGEIKLKDRFRKFLNVPELSLQYTEITDVRNDNNLKLNKPEARLHLVNIQPNEKMQEVNREIIEFAKSGKSEMFGLHLDDKDTSKMLLATTLSAKAAIDLRLVIEDYEEKEGDSGKLTQVVNNVAETYLKFDEHKGTQMIFSDLIENHNTGFSVYSEIKKQLIEKHHIPADQIADIRDYNTDVKRENLFKDMNNGNVRILMGSTSKLGTGVNAQERCVAIHHIDVPWTPSSLDQRNGRGVRQGNQIAKLYNDNKCDVYFYAVERSLDAYKYQLLETKSAFINQVKTNSAQSRDCVEGSGDENEGLSYAEIVAVLSGNPLLLEKSKVDRNVEELTRQRRAFLTNLSQQKDNIETLQIRSTKLTRLIEGNTKDRQKLKENGFVQDKQGLYPITQTINGVKFDKAKEAGEYITREFKDGNPINIEGFGMKSEVHLDPTNLMNRSDQLILTNSEGRIHYSVDFDITSDPTHLGQIFRKLLTSVETNGVSYQNSMEEVKQKQELMKDVDVNAKFPEEEKLNGLLNRQKEITLEFEKEDLEQNDYGTGNVDESEITEEVEGIEESEAEEVEEPSVSYKGGEIEENAAFDAEGKEFTLIERTFSEKQGFDFTGNEKIENAGDIAYLFRNLENSSVENSFGVYQSKEGTTIQYLTTGDDSHTIVPISAMLQGAIAMKADSVTLVHNHPSGSIIPSQMDRDLLAHMKKTFEGRNIKVNDGIIINTRSGKYSTFGSKDGTIEDFRPEKGEKEIPYKVMSFDRLVFSKEYSPDKLDKVRDIQSIVRFISSQRLGER